jgi:hypothetical protein
MKTIISLCLVLSASVFAGYEYTINEYGPSKTLHNTESLFVTGDGGMYSLTLYDSSSALIANTSVLEEGIGGIWSMTMGGNSHLSFQGGQVNQISLHTSAIAIFSGGRIDSISSYQSAWRSEGQPPVLVPNPHITILCQPDWIYNTQSKMLKGSWLDGSKFNIQLVDVAGYSPVIENIRFIPEPATFAMIGLGGALLRRRK